MAHPHLAPNGGHGRLAETDQVAPPHLYTTVSAYADALDALPLDLTRSVSDLRELDAVLGAHLHSIAVKLGHLTALVEDPSVSPAERLMALQAVAQEATAYKMGGEDKIRVATNTCETIISHTDHLNALQETLAAIPLLRPYLKPSVITHRVGRGQGYPSRANGNADATGSSSAIGKRRRVAAVPNGAAVQPITSAAERRRDGGPGTTPQKKRRVTDKARGKEEEGGGGGRKKGANTSTAANRQSTPHGTTSRRGQHASPARPNASANGRQKDSEDETPLLSGVAGQNDRAGSEVSSASRRAAADGEGGGRSVSGRGRRPVGTATSVPSRKGADGGGDGDDEEGGEGANAHRSASATVQGVRGDASDHNSGHSYGATTKHAGGVSAHLTASASSNPNLLRATPPVPSSSSASAAAAAASGAASRLGALSAGSAVGSGLAVNSAGGGRGASSSPSGNGGGGSRNGGKAGSSAKAGGDAAVSGVAAEMTVGGEGEGDADERTYCVCQNVSYGDMIGCDDEECEREWFHLGCVGLTAPPKGSWVCDECKARRAAEKGRGKSKARGRGRGRGRVGK